jgi:pilus assembly protein CpaB
VHWPLHAAVAGSAKEKDSLEGRVVNTTLMAGEPITEKRLAPLGSRAGLNALISPGQRAITVKVNEVVGVAGFALPGNYVDILVTFRKGQDTPVSKIVLEKILVLAVAQDHAIKDETKPKVVSAVTLEVSPEQAEKLDLARSLGSLSMVLRNQTDQAITNTRGVSLSDVITAQKSTAKTAPPQSGPSARIEVIRGISKTSVSAI